MCITVVPFKMQDNSAMGTQSPGKQDTYFRFFKCLVFNLLTWILWMAVWGDFFWLKEREWALHPPPLLLESILGVEVPMGHHPVGYGVNRRMREDELQFSYHCSCVGLSNRTEYLLPWLDLINLLVLIWDKDWQSGTGFVPMSVWGVSLENIQVRVSCMGLLPCECLSHNAY